MSYTQGDVIVAADPFGNAPHRPYLVVSNDTRPFQGEEYIVAGITTTERRDAIALAGKYVEGGLDRESYVSPWALLTVRDDHVTKRVATVSAAVLAATADAIGDYVEPA